MALDLFNTFRWCAPGAFIMVRVPRLSKRWGQSLAKSFALPALVDVWAAPTDGHPMEQYHASLDPLHLDPH